VNKGLALAIGTSVLKHIQTGLTEADVAEVRLGGNHIYRARLKNGKSRPFKSVTAILAMIAKPALIQWAANQAAAYLLENLPVNEPISEARKKALADNCAKEHWRQKEEAAGIGTTAHKFCERWLKGEDIEEDLAQADKRVRNCVQLFFDWWTSRKLTVMHSEVCCWDASLGMAGTADLVCRDEEGRVWLVDFKTGNGIFADMFLQLAAYIHCLQVSHGIDVAGATILRIGKTEPTYYVEDVPVAYWRGVFVAVLSAFYLSKLLDSSSGLLVKHFKGEEVDV